MALVSTAIAGTIMAQFAARSFTGKNDIDIANSVGTAVATYLSTPNIVTCYCTGTAGPTGTIQGITVAGITPTGMSALMLAKAATKRFSGTKMKSFFDAIAFGVYPNLQSMVLQGTVIGCALGSGTGRFQAVNEQAFSAILLSNFASKNLRGKNIKDIAECVSAGIIQTLLSSATFTIVVAGAIAPTPPTGPVPVAMIPSITTKLS